jgi:hypothetical protein
LIHLQQLLDADERGLVQGLEILEGLPAVEKVNVRLECGVLILTLIRLKSKLRLARARVASIVGETIAPVIRLMNIF